MILTMVVRRCTFSILAVVTSTSFGHVIDAHGIEVGDVFFLSKGAGDTVTAVRRKDRDAVEITAQAMDANAAEYCERYEQLTSDSPQWKQCVRENVSRPRMLTVNCRTATIILHGPGGGTGSYRPGNGSGPWVSVANPNWIIQGDCLLKMVCKRR